MDDEIRTFADGRPAVPPYPMEAREAARRRLLQEARGKAGFRFPRIGLQVAGAFGLTVLLVGGVSVALSSGQGAGPESVGSAAVASVEPQVTFAELEPKPGQYLLFESDTMHTSESMGEGGVQSRHLYRTHRTFYQSVETAGGLLRIEGLEPKAWPGQPLPKEAKSWQGGEWMQIDGHCPGTSDAYRTDYAYLSTLPADAEAMRARLYDRDSDDSMDEAAFTAARDLLRETYMPLAQRKALFEAMKTIPGVEVAEGVEDSAGRKGTALGRPWVGRNAQMIFDPASFTVLGERETVIDEKVAGAPVGTIVGHTAQLKVSVVDALPEVDATQDSSCESATMQPQPSANSVEPTPMPTPTSDATVNPVPMPTGVSITVTPTPTKG